MTALADRVSMTVERADFDDLVTLVTQAPTWEKDRAHGVRVLLRAIGEGKANAPDQILARWTWKLATATRKLQDRRASAEFPEAKRLLGALANSRGHRHEENAAKLVNASLELPLEVGAALLASADGYTPRANQLVDAARERLGEIRDVANALADNLPAPKQQPSRHAAAAAGAARRRGRRARSRRSPRARRRSQEPTAPRRPRVRPPNGKPKRRRRRKSSRAAAGADGAAQPAAENGQPSPAAERPRPASRRRPPSSNA